MHAVVYERHGGPDVLHYKEVPDPSPHDGDALVEVEAIGVNFRDVYEREGRDYALQPPAIIGVEGAGSNVATGERVVWLDVPHSYAQRVAADPAKLVPIPDGIPTDVAAAALMQGLTAHYLAHDSYPIQRGDWVIVHAAAGGVGLLLTQMAKLLGGRVIATTSSDDKAQLAREAGAEEVIGYEGFAQRAREITGGEGVAAIYDGIGKTTFNEGLTAIRPLGRMIIYGAASGQPDPVPVHLLAKSGSLYVQRPTIATYIRTPELRRQRAAKVFDLIKQGRLKVRIGAKYPLSEARQAHIDLEARKTTGKILLRP
ncbi:MAG TPA: quinone oxidoreductase [Candidatus Dormibacteraeota bacterium]|nr:quinone oxidoreductase [Candidatus Dormibacteraeota bacterium]